jgi:prevent-host-death family protein
MCTLVWTHSMRCDMRFISVREHKNNLTKTWRSVRRDGYVVLTNHGKPFAVVSTTDAKRLGDSIRELERQRFKGILAEIREGSVRNGTDTMTMEEIDAEVSRMRRERRARRGKGA